ncbi:unnamed protein product, partial [Cylicocyclus nassatus]
QQSDEPVESDERPVKPSNEPVESAEPPAEPSNEPMETAEPPLEPSNAPVVSTEPPIVPPIAVVPPYVEPVRSAGGVITNQPMPRTGALRPVVWMPMPPSMQGVPPGLEYIAAVDEIVVYQLVEMLEIITGYETCNQYSLQNIYGQQVYKAFEDSSCLARMCCAHRRSFTMHILDNFHREVIRMRRPYRCCAGGCFGLCACGCCCSSKIIVEAPPGNVVGTVEQRQACFATCFNGKNADGQVIFRINGPLCCFMCCCQNKKFTVYTQGNDTGLIVKVWGGFEREAFTDADTFNVKFPHDLDVQARTVLLGATFLIDFMEFEDKPKDRNKQH